jgi:uncharacterized protein
MSEAPTDLLVPGTALAEEPAPQAQAAAPPGVAPVAAEERISAVDTLRGVAVLGILLMNILSFGLPDAAEMNPTLVGNARGLNLATWAVIGVVFEGKMRAIFSMLFGAGVVLLTSRAEARGAGIETADIYTRRNLWLMAFGLIHAYFLWAGDVLFPYGLLGLMLFPFRRLRARTLVILAVVLFTISVLPPLVFAAVLDGLRTTAAEAQRAEAAGETLSEEQREALKSWRNVQEELQPDQKAIDKQIKTHRSGYWTVFLDRAGHASIAQVQMLFKYGIFDMAGMMLLGMGLLKARVLTGERGIRFYTAMVILGYGIGLPLNAALAYRVYRSGFDPITLIGGFAYYQWARLPVALAHVGLVLLALRKGWIPALLRRLAAVGQMALTNYLGTTLICTTLFYGYGLGLYAQLERYQLYGVVLAVWALMLWLSPIWLRRFRFGPMEWLWRSLTYWRRQPMRLAPAASADGDGVATVHA